MTRLGRWRHQTPAQLPSSRAGSIDAEKPTPHIKETGDIFHRQLARGVPNGDEDWKRVRSALVKQMRELLHKIHLESVKPSAQVRGEPDRV